MNDQLDPRQRMLDMASELARLAVALPPPPANEEAVALGRSIVARLRQLLAELPKCDNAPLGSACAAPATHKTEYPLDRGGEWPHTCDQHRSQREALSAETRDWVELPYAASLRDFADLLKGSVP